ncbi:unnamed protein product, partial [Owenia fusiformis]
MALVLHLKYAENLRGKADRIAKVNFRGTSYYSRVVENAEESAWFDQVFELPVARAIEAQEMIDIQIFNYSKYLSNRLIGSFGMVLQELVQIGSLKITDYMLDPNNVVMQSTITFDLKYTAPDGSVGMWQKEGFDYENLEDEDQCDLDIDDLDDDKQSETASLMSSSPAKSQHSTSRLSVNSRSSLPKS